MKNPQEPLVAESEKYYFILKQTFWRRLNENNPTNSIDRGVHQWYLWRKWCRIYLITELTHNVHQGTVCIYRIINSRISINKANIYVQWFRNASQKSAGLRLKARAQPRSSSCYSTWIPQFNQQYIKNQRHFHQLPIIVAQTLVKLFSPESNWYMEYVHGQLEKLIYTVMQSEIRQT